MQKKYLMIIVLLLVTATGIKCTDSGTSGGSKDETGMKTIIGYVDAEAFYQISINNKVTDVLEYRRENESILYQPSPDELLRIEYICLDSTIRETGLLQPGNQINPNAIDTLSREIAIEKGKDIVNRLKSGESFQDISKDYGFIAPKKPLRIIKGSSPGYEKAIWGAEIDEIPEPVIHVDRVLIFKVVGRGTNDRGEEYSDILQIDYIFPRDEARKQIEDEYAARWNIRILDLFYSALDKYYDDNFDEAEKDLMKYIRSGKSREGLEQYLMGKIILKKAGANPEDADMNSVKSYLLQAIKRCEDVKLKPYFHYELGRLLLDENNKDGAIEQFVTALEILRTDYDLAAKLVNQLEEFADQEIVLKARVKLDSLEKILHTEQAKQSEIDR